MLQIPYSFGIFATVLGWVLVRGWFCLKTTFDWRRELKLLLFLINLLVVVRFTFYPFAKVDGHVQPLIFEAATAFPFRVNLVPLVNLLDYDSLSDLIINLIGNFAMFIPTGIFLPVLFRKDSWKDVFLLGGGMSLAIEILQLPFAVRASDVDDLILNTLGCLAGYGLYRLFRRK